MQSLAISSVSSSFKFYWRPLEFVALGHRLIPPPTALDTLNINVKQKENFTLRPFRARIQNGAFQL